MLAPVFACLDVAVKEATVPVDAPNFIKRWVMFNKPRSFAAAQAMCESIDGDLASIRSLAEHESYYQAFAGTNEDAWIGLRTRSGTFSFNKQDWSWVSTGQSPGINNAYDGWPSWEPSPWETEVEPSACATARLVSPFGGLFAATPCSRERPYACEIGACVGVRTRNMGQPQHALDVHATSEAVSGTQCNVLSLEGMAYDPPCLTSAGRLLVLGKKHCVLRINHFFEDLPWGT
jgi:hypothetical protein